MPEYAWNALRIASTQYVKGRVELAVEGGEYLPLKGPAIIAARHYHHLIDGVAMMLAVSHPLHILVGLDWIRNPAGKAVMQRLCAAAGWPVVLRRNGKADVDDMAARRALRHAYRDSLEILRRGHMLLVFPEGYPNIDPGYTPKTMSEEFLPFLPGFAQVASGAARMGIDAPVIPAGFHYEAGEQWSVTLRFGNPVRPGEFPTFSDLATHVEQRVRELSRP